MHRFRNLVIAALLFITSAATAGIIGNRANDHFGKLLPFLGQAVPITIGSSLLVLVLGSIPITVLVIKYYTALGILSDLNKLDDSLFRIFPKLYKAESPHEKEMMKKRAAKKLLNDFVKLENFKLCGIALYCPNEHGSYLITWLRFSTPNEMDDESLAFYIGDESTTNSPTGGRGIAGTTFIDGETRVVHFDKHGDADNNIYIPSPSGRIGYHSLICAAIPGAGVNLATLCLYSNRKDKFDSKNMKKMVQSIAERFAVVLDA